MGSIRGEGGAGGGSGGGIAELLDDTTPQLGGNLDVNGFNVGGVTPTELGYISGVTSSVQTQIDGKQASNANLSALAGQTGAADKISYWTAAATLALATLTSFGRSVIAAADAAGLRTLLGLGTAATTDASAYQAADAELTAIAGLTSAADKVPYFTGSGAAALADLSAAARTFIAASTAAAQRSAIQLGSSEVVDITLATNGTHRINLGGYSTADIVLGVATSIIIGNNRPVFFDLDGGGGGRTELSREATGVMRVKNGAAYGGMKCATFESTQTTGTAPLTVASTTVVSNLNADKLDGKDATDFAPCTQSTLTAAASVALDFAAAGLATLTTDQNTTFTTSNRAANRQPYNLRIIGGGAHTLTFPAGWKWLNSTMPAAIASGKTGRLCLECYGTADTDVVASFAVEA